MIEKIKLYNLITKSFYRVYTFIFLNKHKRLKYQKKKKKINFQRKIKVKIFHAAKVTDAFANNIAWRKKISLDEGSLCFILSAMVETSRRASLLLDAEVSLRDRADIASYDHGYHRSHQH